MAETLSDEQLISELEPKAGELLDRHFASTKEWFPHEYIPYSRAEDFGPGYQWMPEESPFPSEDVRSSLFVNLLTEDNLPYYFRDIDRMFGQHGAWRAWAGRWTAEEGRHSMAIYGYLMASRAIDPVVLERGRMVQVAQGEVPSPMTARHGMIYVSLQELATRVSHRNTGAAMADSDITGKKVMDRVGNDENFHYLFYRDVSAAAAELDPSGFVEAVEEVSVNFEMPGTGIPGFTKHAARIALSGIYGLTEYKEKVLEPTLKNWKFWDLEGLSGKAEAARERLSDFLAGLADRVEKEKEKRARRQARLAPA